MIATLFEILTIGIPFCVFKLIAGQSLGFLPLTILGAADLAVNLVNLLSVLTIKRRSLKSCSISIIANIVKRKHVELVNEWHDLGNAIDVFLSFVIVAYVIGSGLIAKMDPLSLQAWNIAVILNVLGAGYGRLLGSYRKLNSKNAPH